MKRDPRNPFLAAAAIAATFAVASPVAKAETKHPDALVTCNSESTTQAGLPVHGAIRCVRSPQCRAEIAKRARRMVQMVSELAISGAEAASDMVAEMLKDPRQDEVLERLDRLERMLKDEGLYTAEVRREGDLMRAAYED